MSTKEVGDVSQKVKGTNKWKKLNQTLASEFNYDSNIQMVSNPASSFAPTPENQAVQKIKRSKSVRKGKKDDFVEVIPPHFKSFI